MRVNLIVLSVVMIAASARGDLFGCGQTAPRRVTAQLIGVAHITVVGRAGTLRVAGRAGARDVVATGTACSDDKDFLNQIQLRAKQNGSDLRIEADIPEHDSLFGWNSAKLDFEVTVPDSMPIDVIDGSGETWIENVGPLKVDDGSGGLTIRGVHGNANITDGSGELIVANVAGDVRINDGSGEIEIDHVGGSVIIDDGSGGIVVRNVQRNVTIENDGSGSVEVSDVRGDFIVQDKGSGSVDYQRVAGRVSVPRRNR